MGSKLETFLVEKITDIGDDWWTNKKIEFRSLPYLKSDNSVQFEGITLVDGHHICEPESITVKFDFLEYAYDSEGYINKLDSAMTLCGIGSVDEVAIRDTKGLLKVKEIILAAIDKNANKMEASYNFMVFIDRTLSLILEELDENSGIIDDDDYTALMKKFYTELESDIFIIYKYKYDASERCFSPALKKFPLNMNIEQIAALAAYLTKVSSLSKSQKLDLFEHLSNVFTYIDNGKIKNIEAKQISRSFRKIKMPKHEGSGLKEMHHHCNELIQAICSGKANDFLDL